MKNFRDLEVWKKAHKLALESYAVTKSFPKEEMFGMTSQMRRCSASIAANIAEGCGRRSNGDFHRFLQNAMGSASELEYHFLLANDLRMLPDETYGKRNAHVTEVKKMLAALILKVDEERRRAEY